ncbi:MAG TPA: 5,10-methylenetetrahydrofolate reductase [Gammaproteobacteria bacterium]|jgi:5,10-methylenetetrahydrofolate reductase|nr:5,10-methylenetetrahydrofolate reductase [Gammaproteobacteria bacterium]
MSRFAQALSMSEFVVTSELIPPKGVDLEPLFEKAEALNQVVTAFNLTESHTAKMSMDPVAVGHLLLDRGVEPIVQMTSRDKNRIAIQASILGAAALGISNIVIMGGDSPKNGDHPEAKGVFDLYSSQVLDAASALNGGADYMGNPLKGAPAMNIGAVVNPGASDPSAEIENLHRKIEAGAGFFQSQAVYDVDALASFLDKADTDAVILAGIIPIKSVQMARFMNDKVPGINIPETLIAEIEAAGDNPDRLAETSIDIAARIIRQIRPLVKGVHIMAIGWEDKIPAIIQRAMD